jgi:opacity protein-like surface antigen
MGRLVVVRDLAAASALFLLLFASPASAQSSFPAGLYVRADVGGAFERDITFKDTNPNAANCDLCGDLFPSSTGNSVFLGAGLGYRLTPMFRADLTVDYLTPVKINGHSTAAASSTGSADFDSLIGLANGYFDLAGAFPDTFGELQPFVSAGIGVARNHLDTTTGVSTLIGPFTLESHSRMNFAWALGGGVGYALSRELTIELAYKYLDTGQVRNGATLAAGGASFQLTPSKTGDLGIHAATLGLRYGF